MMFFNVSPALHVVIKQNYLLFCILFCSLYKKKASKLQKNGIRWRRSYTVPIFSTRQLGYACPLVVNTLFFDIVRTPTLLACQHLNVMTTLPASIIFLRKTEFFITSNVYGKFTLRKGKGDTVHGLRASGGEILYEPFMGLKSQVELTPPRPTNQNQKPSC